MIGKNLTELRLPDKFEIVKDIPFSLWGKKEAEEQTIGYIADLAQVNRQAMQNATNSEKRLQYIGMCVIVFPTILFWFLDLCFFILLKRW